jgi:endonuclease/exonuclease/phosphatase family metal-dependent hydrolase
MPNGLAGSGLRVAFWNIERGLEWELMAAALRPDYDYRAEFKPTNPISDRRWKRALAELGELRRADIIVLNEVDLGMKRTRYADVTRELAEAAGMNYAFGVEFVEVDRLYTGEHGIEMTTPELTKILADDLKVDFERYHGLPGNAILSRFPIRSASIKRLPVCYDWFRDESDSIAALEKGRRWAAKKVFAERIKRQVRRGGRMSLVVELDTGADEPLNVVSTHLEDRAPTGCRREQMADVLSQVRHARGAVVIAGDLNTSAKDGTPTSITYEVKKRVADPRFWATEGVRWLSPVNVTSLIAFPLNLWKNHHDPTAIHIPFIGPNRARRMFQDLRDFRFADGGRLDFSGDRSRSGNGRGRTLANSNQRSWKGFRPTYRMERTYFIAGTYKLDWILVKNGGASTIRGTCQPRNPKTLSHFNELGGIRLSDHHPMTVDMECAAAVAGSHPRSAMGSRSY